MQLLDLFAFMKIVDLSFFSNHLLQVWLFNEGIRDMLYCMISDFMKLCVKLRTNMLLLKEVMRLSKTWPISPEWRPHNISHYPRHCTRASIPASICTTTGYLPCWHWPHLHHPTLCRTLRKGCIRCACRFTSHSPRSFLVCYCCVYPWFLQVCVDMIIIELLWFSFEGDCSFHVV